jgi:hypothetical protein
MCYHICMEVVRNPRLAASMGAWLTLALAHPAEAVILDATGDPASHTNAPSGALAGSGWEYQGGFGNFLATPVAPHFILTARHLGGSTSTVFTLDGTNYHLTALFDDPSPGSDLRLWQVAERLPRQAPVYAGTNEVGAAIAVFGRGTRRGDPVVTDGRTNGWRWGAEDNVMRWGSNTVADIAYGDGAPYLYAMFDHGAGPDECHLSGGDSGGAAFVLADGVWQLAGIHAAVDGHFNTTNAEAGWFDAAIYDACGLYVGSGTNWMLVTNSVPVPSGFYSSRVSAHYAWLTNTIPDFDSRACGLPDWWSLKYSGGIHGLSPADDPDHDGQNNLQEWIARTDPTNAASYFRTDAFVCTNGVATLSFTGWASRVYAIDRHDAPLTGGAWIPATSNAFPGAEGPTFWSDTDAAATSRFYRVRVLLPP